MRIVLPRQAWALLTVLLLTAVAPDARPARFDFDHLALPDGLTHLTTYSILRDSRGFMWFASDEGVYRWDGYDFKWFTHDPMDPSSLVGNLVHDILEDRQGDLWFGTINGLCRLDRGSGQFQQFRHDPDDPASLLGEEVYALYEDRAGRLWVGTWGGLNLFEREKGSFQRFVQARDGAAGLPDYRVMHIAEDPWGVLWVATLDGLCAMRDAGGGDWRFHAYRSIPGDETSLYGNSVYRVQMDADGGMWVGTHSGFARINRPEPTGAGPGLDAVTFTRVLPEVYDGNDDEIIYKISADHRGDLWLSSWGQGLVRYTPQSGRLQRFRHDPGIPTSLNDDTIQSLHVDPDSVGGALWVGTLHGIDVAFPRKRKFAHIRHDPADANSIGNSHVHSVMADSHGDLWVGTMEGLYRQRRGEPGFQQFRAKPEDPVALSADLILSLFEDRGGNLWVGTYHGLHRFDRETETFPQESVLETVDERVLRVHAFWEDELGLLWLGTRHGLIRYDRERQTVKKFDQDLGNPNALPNSNIQDLLIDRSGRFWVGTTAGLAIFDTVKETFRQVSHVPKHPRGLTSSTIWDLFEDSRGEIWVGTNGGLNRLASDSSVEPSSWEFDHYTDEAGLPANHVSGILEDQSGGLWLATSRGLSRLDPQIGSIKNFDAGDGLQSNDFTNAACGKTTAGEFLFGGINGLNSFDPDSIADNPHVPPVVITEFRVFDTPVEQLPAMLLEGEIRLSHRENFFSFEFSALDFTDPDKNRYAYRMEGFDPRWVESGSRRYASYTNLDPGSYRFRVRGSNNDGVWNEAGTSIAIVITPPFWQTWWFRIVIFGLIASLLITVHRYRMTRLLELQRVRARIAEDLHDEIASSLASVRLYSEVVRGQMPTADRGSADLLERIRELSGEVSEGIRQIIWSVDPRHDRLSELLSYLEEQGRHLTEAAGIAFRFRGPDEAGTQALSPEQRRAVYLVLKEGMTNVIRHASCSMVALSVQQEGSRLQFLLEDDGTGFDLGSDGTGHGLTNMRKRAASIGASLIIESAPGAGTRLWLQLKMA